MDWVFKYSGLRLVCKGVNIYVFCIYLRTNSDLCYLQHKLIGFYNRDEKCLQRGTDWVFKYSGLRFVFRGLMYQDISRSHQNAPKVPYRCVCHATCSSTILGPKLYPTFGPCIRTDWATCKVAIDYSMSACGKTTWDFDRFMSEWLGFPLSVSFHHCYSTPLACINVTRIGRTRGRSLGTYENSSIPEIKMDKKNLRCFVRHNSLFF